jgi:adenine-specific DNA-methyltransferase
MPTLHWIGKEKVINHHLEVPYRVLNHQYGFTADAGKSPTPTQGGNKIIHGDNLEALKALLPEYEGRIKCIYIDPPYNTGNEGWVYNDNVNDPKIKKWLAEVVGKEGEDLSRHDKWLCMMYPRLKLLHKLLADDGVIFISIDDVEVCNLRLVLDEIWGTGNFISQFVWKSRVSEDARAITRVSNDHEYILCYYKRELSPLRGADKDLTKFNNPDNDLRGPWRSADLTGLATMDQRPNLHYKITDPETGITYDTPLKGWRFEQSTMRKKIAEGRIIFPKSKGGRPRQKIFINEMNSTFKSISSVITSTNTGKGTRAINEIFGESKFDFPKPVDLPQMLIEQTTYEIQDSIILDSFAGSGTTAHAVFNLNQQDGGNRKVILVEMEDYAETITAERVKRVIKGYGEGSKAVAGTGGSFDYYTLGKPLFDEYDNLNEAVGPDRIREYVWFSETRSAYHDNPSSNGYLLGKKDECAYYFYYEPDALTELDYHFLGTIDIKADQYVIYADNCLLPEEFMLARNIIFKKIPRDITRF